MYATDVLRYAQVRNEKARRFLLNMRKKPGVNFTTYFPRADPGAVALLRRMLSFDPADRPTSEACASPHHLVHIKPKADDLGFTPCTRQSTSHAICHVMEYPYLSVHFFVLWLCVVALTRNSNLSAQAALADPYFAGLSQPAREPSAQPVSKLAFEFERRKLQVDEVRD